MSREPGGRPLRFFALLAIGWVTIRLASQPLPADIAPQSLPAPALRSPARPLAALVVSPPHPLPAALALRSRHVPQIGGPAVAEDDGTIVDLMHFIHVSNAFANRQYGGAETRQGGEGFAESLLVQPSPVPIPSPLAPQQASDRWRASAWVLWRPGGAGGDIARTGRLGGSQAGVRVDHDLATFGRKRVAAYARATSALERPAAPEAALGLAIQADRAIPATVAIERRVSLGEGGRNANAAYVSGGFGPTRIIESVEASGYAQAGIVGFRRSDGFVDGKLSLLAPVVKSPLKLGGSLSGGAQPGVHRVDVGPEAQLRLPLPATAARLSLEWRERIAGRAAPASGITLTLAADF